MITGKIGLRLGILFCNSHSNFPPPIYQMATTPLSAFVIGATGTAGKGIVKALIENPNYDRVSIIGRRILELPTVSDRPGYSKIDQKIMNFEDESSYAETFKGYDVGFCALGIASAGISKEDYYRITHDYVINSAKGALDGGCRHFHFISGQSTSNNSIFNWAKVKAEVEEELKGMGFERLSLYRPAGIVKDKTEPLTTLESAGVCAFKVLDPFGLISVDSILLGKVIVANTFRVTEDNKETLENSDILKLGKNLN